MTTERTTRNQRRLLVGLLGAATGLAVILGIALGAGGENRTSSGGASRTSTTTEAPVAVDAPAAAAGGDPSVGSTEACRVDPTCPSSEHRTSDPCGAAVIVDLDGYLEGRHDAEQGRPYQIDGAPAPTPADDDDDDATVGPQTLYRAGYAQGWCDGGGVHPASR